MAYDYKEGKKRILEILKSTVPIEKVESVPTDENFTYNNAIRSWITSVFVDIRNSTPLFQKEDEKDISKLIRSFTSEIIEVMKLPNTYREIGIRGDCVYAIYSTPKQKDINDVMNKVVEINTLIKMFNKLFENNGLKTIEVGIGVASSEDLIIKAGRKGTGINDKIWIGDSVITACNLGNIGSKYDRYRNVNINPIVINDTVYNNILAVDNQWSEFYKKQYYENKEYITMNVINIEFNNWINNGMDI